MDLSTAVPSLNLTNTELNSIDDYRKKKNTAVLTIMFTDIEGFTALTDEKGESYVHYLHAEHDRILSGVIEAGNVGMVIKYIGDSIMAVFSEPTAAVERALKIQRELAAFNAEHTELEDIKVRIGLHMGQTVIENKILLDLFGRHVNKASRIEGLADGGHVYVSYPVFDSAKTWLLDANNVGFKLHGSYHLKGIKKPEEIYEVYNTDLTKPQAPRRARRYGLSTVSIAAVAVSVLVVILGVFFAFRFFSAQNAGRNGLPDSARELRTEPGPSSVVRASSEKNEGAKSELVKTDREKKKAKNEKPAAVFPEVYLNQFAPEEPILDLKGPLATKTIDESTRLKLVINEISEGRHLIHYTPVSEVRYYAEISVGPGKNVIEPLFMRSELPSIYLDFILDTAKESGALAKEDEKAFFVYDPGTLKKIEYTGKVRAEVTAKRFSENQIDYGVTYSVVENGNEVASGQFSVLSPMHQSDRTNVDEKRLFEDGFHYYTLKYSYINNNINLDLGANFIGK